MSLAIADLAGRDPRALADEPGMLAGGDEADLLAVLLLRDAQSEAPRLLAHRRLVQRADGEARPGELRLGQREEEVGLVLGRVDAALEAIAAGPLVEIDLRVVAGRDGLGLERRRALD